MGKAEWLPLTEYAAKYGISISTLRRRIRNEAIKYRLEEGKYLIQDSIVTKDPAGRKPIDVEGRLLGSQTLLDMKSENHSYFPAAGSSQIAEATRFVTAANSLLEELKKAYALILQEKEEQICQLKDEISDLRTLVRVLESENERLRTGRR